MLIVADTHAHVYPCYDAGSMFSAAAGRMDSLAGGREHANLICLAERRDCAWFAGARRNALRLPDGSVVSAHPSDEKTLIFAGAGGARIHILAGRQIATAERLEILAPACLGDFSDGIPALESAAAVRECGGIPVLAWAPGKWMFGRSVAALGVVEAASPSNLLLGDSAIRPEGLPAPALTRRAVRAGFRVVHGSDPLPLSGEERLIGGYCSVMEGDFDSARPSESFMGLLRSGAVPEKAGRRCSFAASALRMLRAAAYRRRRLLCLL